MFCKIHKPSVHSLMNFYTFPLEYLPRSEIAECRIGSNLVLIDTAK